MSVRKDATQIKPPIVIEDEGNSDVDFLKEWEARYFIARTTKEEALARKYELENELQKQTLVPVELVAEEFRKQVQTMRQRLDALPNKLAPRLVGQSEIQKVQTILETAIREVKETLSND